MTILYLCEKPSQARDIARVLGATQKHEHYLEGKNIKVTWCVGHLLETAPPDDYIDDLKPWRIEKLPIIPQTWRMHAIDKTKKQLNAIKGLLKTCDTVVIATDADREGEVIAREILDLCHYNGKIERLWLSALDDVSIKKALSHLKPGIETKNLYAAGLARQRADWLVGMNMTMAASCLFGQRGDGALSVGRVQTPTLKLIVDRDHEIEQFKPRTYFVVQAQFKTSQNQLFWTTWQVPNDKADEEGRCVDQHMAEHVIHTIGGQSAKVERFQEDKKQQSPPLCLSLSQLQKLASSRFGFSAKKVLDIAQSLYETHKAITYPRTDCSYLPESQWHEASTILNVLQTNHLELAPLISQCDITLKSPVWNDQKMTAHHAMIPTTNPNVDIQHLSEDEYTIYTLICRYYLAQFLGDYVYQARSVLIHCQNETFKALSQTPITLGWKCALRVEENEEKQNDASNLIPLLNSSDMLTQHDQRLETKQTKPPAHFTEGSLIDAMKNIGKYVDDPALKNVLKETAGIGTEATRANILETLLKRAYLVREGKQLKSTAKGKNLIALLPDIITHAATTALWEQALDAIAEGKITLESFLESQAKTIHHMLGALIEKKTQHPKNLSPRRSDCVSTQKPIRAGNRQ